MNNKKSDYEEATERIDKKNLIQDSLKGKLKSDYPFKIIQNEENILGDKYTLEYNPYDPNYECDQIVKIKRDDKGTAIRAVLSPDLNVIYELTKIVSGDNRSAIAASSQINGVEVIAKYAPLSNDISNMIIVLNKTRNDFIDEVLKIKKDFFRIYSSNNELYEQLNSILDKQFEGNNFDKEFLKNNQNLIKIKFISALKKKEIHLRNSQIDDFINSKLHIHRLNIGVLLCITAISSLTKRYGGYTNPLSDTCNEPYRDAIGYEIVTKMVENLNTPFFCILYASHLVCAKISPEQEEDTKDMLKRENPIWEDQYNEQFERDDEEFDFFINVIEKNSYKSSYIYQAVLIEHAAQSLQDYMVDISETYIQHQHNLSILKVRPMANAIEIEHLNREMEKFENITKSIIAQIILALYVSQTTLKYNHNDFHLNNIRIDEIPEDVYFYHDFTTTLGKIYRTRSRGVRISVIDHGFFSGRFRKRSKSCYYELEKYDDLKEHRRKFDYSADLIYVSGILLGDIKIIKHMPLVKDFLMDIVSCKDVKNPHVNLFSNFEDCKKNPSEHGDVKKQHCFHRAALAEFKSKYECTTGNPKDYLYFFNEKITEDMIPTGSLVYSMPHGYIK